ncbi:penicillin-binding protein 2 [Claveliimonas bilis]|uniref:peptidoglycan D,D-transpeptidase FtsI family protein n=1 Tax=Clostridia TaxID=186801 RepID=UPI00210D4385|nr:penicillin-binding transpeptidase domain-containing protein [Claveliimonas bilis]MCQ5202583.1 penicillin-binding transpeptidase domain-containing protein [Mordavella massiliensis]BDZ78990.1 stage V sporulation protein D [Claveliimonas bilis]
MTKKTMHRLRKKFPKFMQKKLVILYLGIILAFVFLIGRITYINASDGEEYTKIVLDQQQYDSRVIPYKRGDIVDRNGTKIATSERVYNVILDVKTMLSDEDYVEPTKQVLKDCFGIEEEEVDTLIEESPDSRYSVLKKGIDYNTAKEFEAIDEDDENYPDVKGIWLESDYVRTYPYNTLASDVIGFTVDGNVGNGGIEGYYNTILNGTDGREYGYLDGGTSVEQTVKEPINGKTVVSTIDVQVQSIVEKYIKQFNDERKNNATAGEGSKNTAVMIMNPQNGEILAEASYPNYDLNNPRDLSSYYTQEQLDAMSDEEQLDALNSLWKNFCVSDTYEPGSTIKPFTVAAALETGALNGDETFYCEGSLHIGGYDIHCINREGHGTQTLKEAVENSCNVALMQIGEKIGAEDFIKYQHIFGFGELAGIDLPGEAATEGLLYTVDNMDETSLATNAFGQNFNVTMTQMLAGFCSLINGGEYYEPHIVKQIQDENGNVVENEEPVLVKRTISEETSTLVKDYMRGVVQNGSGKLADLEGYEVGGKTGTAEKLPRSEGKNLVSFIGYAPQENPEIAIYVVIDEPNEYDQAQSSLAVQMASDIMKEIFPYLGISKTSETADDTATQ